jgi:cell pole-organizing protein PopZ
MAKAQAQEPSMEEILASIRRIIADEDKAPAAPAVAEDTGAESRVSEEDLDRLFAAGGDDDDAAPEAEADPFDMADAGDDEAEDEDVLDLTEEAVADPDLDLIDGRQEDITFADPPPPAPVAAPAAQRPAAPPAPPLPVPAPKAVAAAEWPAAESLISAPVSQAVAAAFGNLNNVVTHRGGHTIEELVQELMRPMLRAWLDDNLPPLVERLVKAEIERVARGGR